jgi:hypothetical protein
MHFEESWLLYIDTLPVTYTAMNWQMLRGLELLDLVPQVFF